VRVLSLGTDVPASVQASMFASVPDILVCTPARLCQLLANRTVVLRDSLKMLVIDEADLMMTYGYTNDLQVVVSNLPSICQSMLMSATLSTGFHSRHTHALLDPNFCTYPINIVEILENILF
jgi:ATP-dependent RNA helicase DDX56/DBP9